MIFERHLLVRYLTLGIVVIGIALIPLKVIGYGFLPPDDASRHAAKVISGKNWNEILVLREDIKMDSHPGWHAILGLVHRLTNWNTEGLAVFSVVFFFILFSLGPILLLKRPEVWPLSLVTIMIANPSFLMRLLLGRPYILTMSIVVVLCFLWPAMQNKKIPYHILLMLTLLMTASTWIHCSWHLLFLPLICFFIARQWRVSVLVGVCVMLGILFGVMLTSQPYLFLKQTLFHTIRAFGNHDLQRMLVTEFQPFNGDVLIVMMVLGVLFWRKICGTWEVKLIDNPIFIMALTGWALGFVSVRFWLDWGMPALAVWMALEFQNILKDKIDFLSWRRFLLSIVLVGILYVAATSDYQGRWTANLNIEYLSSENPKHAAWLPESGGVVYSDDMGIFYQTFFKNPKAPWRYILGFEPTMMPPEDLSIFRKIQWNFGAFETFAPWIKKMKPADRLIIRRAPLKIEGVPDLEWNYTVTGTWIGRLPKDLDKTSSKKAGDKGKVRKYIRLQQ